MNSDKTVLGLAAGRLRMRKDLEKAAKNPGTPVLMRNTVGKPRNAQYVRAHEYRSGTFAYGLSVPPECVADVYYDERSNGVRVVFRPGTEVGPPSLDDKRAAALLRAHKRGEAPWPGELKDPARFARNARLRKANLKIGGDGIVRRIPEGE